MIITQQAIPLEQLDGHRIRVRWNKQGNPEPVEHEGSVVAASKVGLLVKPRGATLAELIASEDILDLEILRNPNLKLITRKLRVMKLTEVRQHLVDRHGCNLEYVENLSDVEAMMLHTEMGHAGLGHVHEDKRDTPRAVAIKEAEHSDDADSD